MTDLIKHFEEIQSDAQELGSEKDLEGDITLTLILIQLKQLSTRIERLSDQLQSLQGNSNPMHWEVTTDE